MRGTSKSWAGFLRGSAKSWPSQLDREVTPVADQLDRRVARRLLLGGTAHASPHRCLAPRNPRLPGFNSPVWVYNQQASQPQSVLFSPQPRKNYLQTWGSQPSQPPSVPLLLLALLQPLPSPPAPLPPPSPPATVCPPSPPAAVRPPSPPSLRPRVLVLRWVTPRVILSPGVIHLNNRMTIDGSHITAIVTNFQNHHPSMLSLKTVLPKAYGWISSVSDITQLTGWIGFTWVWPIFTFFSENL